MGGGNCLKSSCKVFLNSTISKLAISLFSEISLIRGEHIKHTLMHYVLILFYKETPKKLSVLQWGRVGSSGKQRATSSLTI